MQTYKTFISITRFRRQVWPGNFAYPVVEISAEGWGAGDHGAFGGLVLELDPFLVDFVAGFAVDVLAAPEPGGCGDPGVGGVAVFVGVDGSFAVGTGPS